MNRMMKLALIAGILAGIAVASALFSTLNDVESPQVVDDADRDGFTIAQGDCLDDWPYTYPGAPLSGNGWSVCDVGADTNCNGIEDGKEPECSAPRFKHAPLGPPDGINRR